MNKYVVMGLKTTVFADYTANARISFEYLHKIEGVLPFWFICTTSSLCRSTVDHNFTKMNG